MLTFQLLIAEPSSDVVTPSRASRSSRASSRARGGGPSTPQQQPPSEIIEASEGSSSAPHLVIWGTDVSVQVCKTKFKNFLKVFIDEDMDEEIEGFDKDQPLYLQRLEEVKLLVHPRWIL